MAVTGIVPKKKLIELLESATTPQAPIPDAIEIDLVFQYRLKSLHDRRDWWFAAATCACADPKDTPSCRKLLSLFFKSSLDELRDQIEIVTPQVTAERLGQVTELIHYSCAVIFPASSDMGVMPTKAGIEEALAIHLSRVPKASQIREWEIFMRDAVTSSATLGVMHKICLDGEALEVSAAVRLQHALEGGCILSLLFPSTIPQD